MRTKILKRLRKSCCEKIFMTCAVLALSAMGFAEMFGGSVAFKDESVQSYFVVS